MWPAAAVSTGFSLLACIWNSLPSRSFLPLVELMTCEPESTLPEYTGTEGGLPKNGGVATLNASAENGSSVDGLRMTSTSSLPGAWPTAGGKTKGEGRERENGNTL